MAALRPRSAATPAPLSAPAARLQQAAARLGRHAPLADRGARATPPCSPTMCGWSTPRRWSAPGRGRRCTARRWPAGPSTATAPATPATSGGYGCICCAPCTGCRSASPSPRQDRRTGGTARHPRHRPRPDHRPSKADVIADRHYYGRQFETTLNSHGITLLRPARAGETPRPGAGLFRPLRQVIESIKRHPQRPARPRTARRAHPDRGLGPRPATSPGAHRGHLAQRPRRRTNPTITDRLRPLTLGISHLVPRLPTFALLVRSGQWAACPIAAH